MCQLALCAWDNARGFKKRISRLALHGPPFVVEPSTCHSCDMNWARDDKWHSVQLTHLALVPVSTARRVAVGRPAQVRAIPGVRNGHLCSSHNLTTFIPKCWR